jgi:hypothetical protein
MTPSDRARKNGLSFLETLVSPGGFTIRPLGYLTVVNIQLLGLQFGTADKSAPVPMDHVHAFLFIQAAPLTRVSRAIRAHSKLLATTPPEEAFEEFLVTHVEPWLAEIPPDGIAAAFEQLSQLDEIDAAAIVASPPPGQKSDPPDPN